MTESLDKLIAIMDKLLAPDGCPWDAEQTHESLIPYLIEETYEVVQAIQDKSISNLKEELGDLLLQVIFHSALAQRNGNFTINDVANEISEKLIRRHPHVFGSKDCKTADDVATQWDAIKQSENKFKNEAYLDSVPRALPALMQAYKLTKKAAKIGFDWDNKQDILNKLNEELGEISEAFTEQNKAHIQEEAGDLLFVLVNWFRHQKIDPELALQNANNKFRNRFSFMESAIIKDNKDKSQLSLSEWDVYWNKAKENEN